MNIKWNAQGYTKDFQFVHEYGEDVLNLLEIEKGMKILDLGCGNGALTKKMADMGADVIGMDASKDMLEVAKSNFLFFCFIVIASVIPIGSNKINCDNQSYCSRTSVVVTSTINLLIPAFTASIISNL